MQEFAARENIKHFQAQLEGCTDQKQIARTRTTESERVEEAIARMKPGALLINTSRGAVVDTHAVIGALKRRRLGGLAIDVYEEEDALFFEDRSDQAIMDDQFARLLTFPNVLITGHQGFFTVEALTNIAATTIGNLDNFEQTGRPLYPVMTDSPLVQEATQLAPAS